MKDTLEEINRSHPGRKIIDSKKCRLVWGEGEEEGGDRKGELLLNCFSVEHVLAAWWMFIRYIFGGVT